MRRLKHGFLQPPAHSKPKSSLAAAQLPRKGFLPNKTPIAINKTAMKKTAMVIKKIFIF